MFSNFSLVFPLPKIISVIWQLCHDCSTLLAQPTWLLSVNSTVSADECQSDVLCTTSQGCCHTICMTNAFLPLQCITRTGSTSRNIAIWFCYHTVSAYHRASSAFLKRMRQYRASLWVITSCLGF